MPGLTRIALIVDNLAIARWQADALDQLGDEAEFVLLNCTNTHFTRRPLRHAFYYLLNIVSLKNPATRPVPLPRHLNIVERLDFDSEWDGAWQRLPVQVLEALAGRRPDLAIKFGMGLLRVPDELQCRILPYHHGDPRRFRGRPAGFYELLGGVPTVGQIVQIISDRLDAGAVVVFAETRVQPHSYRATMAESYRMSPLLMRTAVRNCLSGTVLPIEPRGRNYRLPSNAVVARFAGKLLWGKLKRFFYGGFFQKDWEVASADVAATGLEQLKIDVAERSRWSVVPRPARYGFLADPFPHPESGVLVEALRRSDGQGEIVHFDQGSARTLCTGPGHFSYPATVRIGNEHFMLPEVSEWTAPRLYRLSGETCEFAGELDVERRPRLVDATLHASDDGVYLFANAASDGSEVLRLWTADTLLSRFSEHPLSPILISPVGGRMAGALLQLGERLYRLGQDCAEGYGRRTVIFEVLNLSRTGYSEVRADDISFAGVTGPHTLNVRGSTAFFDYYRERFSTLAGVRRLRAVASKRSAARTARFGSAAVQPAQAKVHP